MKDAETKPPKTTDAHCFTPRADIWETSEALHVELEMPGVAPDAVDVRLEEGVLTVLGRVPAKTEGERLLSEFEVGNYERSFRVSDGIDGARIEFPDGWGLLRVSNTSPMIVIRCEANSKKRLNEIQKLIEGKFNELK